MLFSNCTLPQRLYKQLIKSILHQRSKFCAEPLTFQASFYLILALIYPKFFPYMNQINLSLRYFSLVPFNFEFKV